MPGSWEHFKLVQVASGSESDVLLLFKFIYKLQVEGLLPASAEGPGSQIQFRAAIAIHRSIAAARTRSHLRGPCLTTWGGLGCHGYRGCSVHPATTGSWAAGRPGAGHQDCSSSSSPAAESPVPVCQTGPDRPWCILTRASGPLCPGHPRLAHYYGRRAYAPPAGPRQQQTASFRVASESDASHSGSALRPRPRRGSQAFSKSPTGH